MKYVDTIRPKHLSILKQIGENIRLARLRRSLSSAQVAERAGMTRSTLSLLENGSPSVSIGRLLKVLVVLGMEDQLISIGADDELGQKLQDIGLGERRRAPSKRKRRT